MTKQNARTDSAKAGAKKRPGTASPRQKPATIEGLTQMEKTPIDLSASAHRVFFDWNQPPLALAAEWLCTDELAMSNLGRAIIVLPTARACLTLERLYQNACEQRNLMPVPLNTITVGQLPDQLFDQGKPIAPPLARVRAWLDALRSIGTQNRNRLFPGVTELDVVKLMEVAGRLQSLHERLGADVWSFKSVQREIVELANVPSPERWDVLAQLQDHYYATLNSKGYWDPQAARNVAVRKKLCRALQPLILIGLVDLNAGIHEMLEQCLSQVTSLIFCREEDRDGFDGLGCLRPDFWSEYRLQIPDERIRIADKPIDQANYVGRFATQMLDVQKPADIVVGLPDEELWPNVERCLKRVDAQSHLVKGESIVDNVAMRLFNLLAQYLLEPSYWHFAELIRHPDVNDFVSSRLNDTNWLPKIDEFQNLILPAEVRIDRPQQYSSLIQERFPIVSVVEALRDLAFDLLPSTPARELKEKSIDHRSLGDWASSWLAVLRRLYGPNLRAMEPDDQRNSTPVVSLGGLNHTTRTTIERLAGLFHDVSQDEHATMEVDSPRDALKLILRFLEDRVVASDETNSSIDVVGWLELPWESANSAVIVGLNDHVVPSVERGSTFLPNSLCTRLGLSDNRRRLARDVYHLALVNASRANVLLVCGRQNSLKAPILISRLLLQCPDEQMVRRSTGFFDFPRLAHQETQPSENHTQSPLTQQFAIPMPTNVPRLSRLSVTRFRDYLKCPYRFYLGAVLKLRPEADDAREMSAGQFGDLAHNVLEEFGRSPTAHLTDSEAIKSFLVDTLEAHVKRLAVRNRLPSMLYQIEHLQLRLEHFAQKQAEHRQSGWRIVSIEEKFEFPFVVDNEPFIVIGKIDRVDQHDDGRITVWDYKTSEKGYNAAEAHIDSQGNWIDLQLPLYRHMIQSRFPSAPLDSIGLGYVVIPNDTKKIRFAAAGWNSEQLAAADATARDVIRKIRECRYWPPVETPKYSYDWERICQDNVFERWQEFAE